jgi:RNA polymerase sigma factor (sigma-70 family)
MRVPVFRRRFVLVLITDGPMQTDPDEWFVREILPLEAALMRYLRRNWRDVAELPDLRQEVYVRVFQAARVREPEQAGAFLFSTARNLLIDRARRAQIVSIATFADLEEATFDQDQLTPERHASGRAELRVLQQALNALPPRCKQVVSLRKIDGMSQREIADTMGIAVATVEKQMAKGMRALADALLGSTSLAAVRTTSTPRHRHEGEQP